MSAANRSAGYVLAPISAGELLDKITILEIKSERLTDPRKLENVGRELAKLMLARKELATSNELDRLVAELKEVNLALWQIEDDLRACEHAGDFGPRFIELARSVYHRNDRRSVVKRQINELLGSELIEEKSYTEYRK